MIGTIGDMKAFVEACNASGVAAAAALDADRSLICAGRYNSAVLSGNPSGIEGSVSQNHNFGAVYAIIDCIIIGSGNSACIAKGDFHRPFCDAMNDFSFVFHTNHSETLRFILGSKCKSVRFKMEIYDLSSDTDQSKHGTG